MKLKPFIKAEKHNWTVDLEKRTATNEKGVVVPFIYLSGLKSWVPPLSCKTPDKILFGAIDAYAAALKEQEAK